LDYFLGETLPLMIINVEFLTSKQWKYIGNFININVASSRLALGY